MVSRQYKHIVPNSHLNSQRLSRYLIGKFLFLESGSAVKKAIVKGEVNINGRTGLTGDWVSKGDVIEYTSSFDKPISNFAHNVVYVDDFLMIINKPPGLLSNGNARSLQGDLHSYPMSKLDDALFYPYLVHRLDRQTCGLIVAARTMNSRRELGHMIFSNLFSKTYSLIVEGHLDSSIINIEQNIDGKTAKTEIISCKHLNTKDPSSYVRVKLHTGRTHQIRKHFLNIGNPIVGDDIYNKGGLSFGRGLFLMADSLAFNHPITGSEIKLNETLHKKFDKYLNELI